MNGISLEVPHETQRTKHVQGNNHVVWSINMMHIPDETIDRLIKEDLPYIDLTTMTLGIHSIKGRMIFTARENTVLCGTEESSRVFSRFGLAVDKMLPTGTRVEPGDIILVASGYANALHSAWKVSLNILEYFSGIATRTRKIVNRAKSANAEISVVTTRKICPGTKELSIKAAIAGGALPHRLGLSETILLFKQHRAFFDTTENPADSITRLKKENREKKIIVECDSSDNIDLFIKSGADGIQFDKINPEILAPLVKKIRKHNPFITLIATGGIKENNAAEYAATGVDLLSTSSVYSGKPSDIGVSMEKI
jgi:molybdenum transport protein